MVAVADAASVLANQSKWPTVAKTARLIYVDASTLNKQVTAGRVLCVRLGLGRGTLHVSPHAVLWLAVVYGRVPVESVCESLAHELAKGTSVAEKTIVRELDRMSKESDVRSRDMLLSSEPKQKSRGVGAGTTRATGTSDIQGARKVDKRKLQPLAVKDGDILPMASVRNLESAQLVPLKGVVQRRKPKVIEKRAIYPGMRF